MNNIENMSTSVITTLTIRELKNIFKNNNNLELLEKGNITFCIDILKYFGVNLENTNLENIAEVNLDFEYGNKVILQGPKVNIYDKNNKLISKKLSNKLESQYYGVENFEVQIFEELNFNSDDIDEFIEENQYNSEFVTKDVCSLIHMSGYELDLKKYNDYINLIKQYEESKNEMFKPFIEKAKKECYSYKELYITKNLIEKNVRIMHGYTPYIVNADSSELSFTLLEFDEIVNKSLLASGISHSYEYDKLSLEEKNTKDSFMDLVTIELKNYNRYLHKKRGYTPSDQMISQSTLASLKNIILLDESKDNDKISFKTKVIGNDHSLVENVLGKQKTLNKSI